MVPSDQVDQQVLCRPQPQCALCQGDVVVHEDKAIHHQVFDLPPITLRRVINQYPQDLKVKLWRAGELV
jgi:hypothetical protein